MQHPSLCPSVILGLLLSVVRKRVLSGWLKLWSNSSSCGPAPLTGFGGQCDENVQVRLPEKVKVRQRPQWPPKSSSKKWEWFWKSFSHVHSSYFNLLSCSVVWWSHDFLMASILSSQQQAAGQLSTGLSWFLGSEAVTGKQMTLLSRNTHIRWTAISSAAHQLWCL